MEFFKQMCKIISKFFKRIYLRFTLEKVCEEVESVFPKVPHWMYNPHCCICGTGSSEQYFNEKLQSYRVRKLPNIDMDWRCTECAFVRDEAAKTLRTTASQCFDITARSMMRRAARLLEDKTGLLESEIIERNAADKLMRFNVSYYQVHGPSFVPRETNVQYHC